MKDLEFGWNEMEELEALDEELDNLDRPIDNLGRRRPLAISDNTTRQRTHAHYLSSPMRFGTRKPVFELESSPITYSCEPGKYQRGKVNVIWWGKRTKPGKREIPKGLDLAILSRARMRLPIQSIGGIIASNKERKKWPATALPANYEELLPEVNVTVELFLKMYELSEQEIEDSLDEYLKRRHAIELPGCSFYTWVWDWASNKNVIEDTLRLKSLGLDLNQLYKKARVPLSGISKGEDVIIFVYASFPDALEKFLIPVGPKPHEPDKPVVKDELSEEEIKALVWMLIGHPGPNIWQILDLIKDEGRDLIEAVWDGLTEVHLSPINAYDFWKLIDHSLERTEKIRTELSGIRGMAYALMDHSTRTYRNQEDIDENQHNAYQEDYEQKAFAKGYRAMKTRLYVLRDVAGLRSALDKLGSSSNKAIALRMIYDAMMDVYYNKGTLGKEKGYTSLYRWCGFKYPKIRVNCGPRSDLVDR